MAPHRKPVGRSQTRFTRHGCPVAPSADLALRIAKETGLPLEDILVRYRRNGG